MGDRADALRRIALDLAGGQASLHVSGYSMWPLLRPADVVKVQSVPVEALCCGDLIVVRRADQADWITHRLVWVDEHGWHAKGDNCRQADAPVAAQAIVGRVAAIERGGIGQDMTRMGWVRANRWLGRLGCWEARLARRFGARPMDGVSIWTRAVTWPLRVLTRLILFVQIRTG